MPPNRKIGVVGLGYVGLPLAVNLGRHFSVTGFDRDKQRINDLLEGRDRTHEVSLDEITRADIRFTANEGDLKEVNFFIVTVPTPVDGSKNPDLSCLKSASESVGRNLKRGDIVVFESTVYPGVTEEVCGPIMEKVSGFASGEDFFLGYSPERINPGDKKNTLSNVTKIISAQDEKTLSVLESVYGAVVKSGLYRAPSIKVAEAAKVIENIQRDLNIALMNEIAIICHRLGIETSEVLKAAGTKWNFIRFTPGLVGGHCIGVDPYYFTHKAEQLGYHPQVILSGRRINDGMGPYIVQQAIKKMIHNHNNIRGAKALVLGVTFKENVPDLRNSRIPEMVTELESFGVEVDVHDPLADPDEAKKMYNITLRGNLLSNGRYNLILLAVGHEEYRKMGVEQILQLAEPHAVVVDVKWLFEPTDFNGAGLSYWRI